jgi:hypothetical protein
MKSISSLPALKKLILKMNRPSLKKDQLAKAFKAFLKATGPIENLPRQIDLLSKNNKFILRINFKTKTYKTISLPSLSPAKKQSYELIKSALVENQFFLDYLEPIKVTTDQVLLKSRWGILLPIEQKQKTLILFFWTGVKKLSLKKTQKMVLIWNKHDGRGILNDTNLFYANKSIFDHFPLLPPKLNYQTVKDYWDKKGNLYLFNNNMILWQKTAKEIGFTISSHFCRLYLSNYFGSDFTNNSFGYLYSKIS